MKKDVPREIGRTSFFSYALFPQLFGSLPGDSHGFLQDDQMDCFLRMKNPENTADGAQRFVYVEMFCIDLILLGHSGFFGRGLSRVP